MILHGLRRVLRQGRQRPAPTVYSGDFCLPRSGEVGWRWFQEGGVPASGLASRLSSPPPPAAPFGFKITPCGPRRGGRGSTPVHLLLPNTPAAPRAPRRCPYPQNTLAVTPAPRCALAQGGHALVASPCSALLAGGPGCMFYKDQDGEASAYTKTGPTLSFFGEYICWTTELKPQPNSLKGNRIPRNTTGGKCVRCYDKQV